MIVFKLGFIGRPGPRLAGHALAALGVPGARRSTRGRSARWCPRCSSACCCSSPARRVAYVFVVPQALRVLFSFQTEAIAAVHHLRRVLRLRAPGRARAGPLVRAAAGHHHPRLARGDRPGGAATVPPVRGRGRLRRGRAAVARDRPGLDDHDDHPADPALRGGIRGRGRHPPPAAQGGGRWRRSCCSASGWARRAPRRRCRVKPQRPRRPGRAGGLPDSLQDPAGERSRARRSTPPPRAGSASPPRPPAASPRTTRCSTSCSRRGPATSPPATGPIRPRSSSRSERVLLEGQALTERQGAMLEADTIRYQRNSCLLDATGTPHLFDRGQVLVGEGIRYDTCSRRGIGERRAHQFHRGLDRLVPARATSRRTRAPAGSTPDPARSPAATCRRRTTTSAPAR